MTPSQAETQGLERASKYPKSTKYGRQNPITARWNSEEWLVLWRAAWAEAVNSCLERSGYEERIDHRSYVERGLDEQPTIHEGVAARAMEKKGIVSDRCELNRQIKADNALLRALKAQVKKLTELVKGGVAFFAETLENLRKNMIIFRYQLLHIGAGKGQIERTLDAVRPDLERYALIVRQIKSKSKERKALLVEKKATSPLQVLRHWELSQKIATLTEDLEELRSEKAVLLNLFECVDDAGISAVKNHVAKMETDLQTLEQQDERYSTELTAALTEYGKLMQQTENVDPSELDATRQATRPDMESEAVQQLQNGYGERYDAQKLRQSQADVASMLGEVQQRQSLQLQIRQREETQVHTSQKRQSREQER